MGIFSRIKAITRSQTRHQYESYLLTIISAAALVSAAPVSGGVGVVPMTDNQFRRLGWCRQVECAPSSGWPKRDVGPTVDRQFQRLQWPKRDEGTTVDATPASGTA